MLGAVPAAAPAERDSDRRDRVLNWWGRPTAVVRPEASPRGVRQVRVRPRGAGAGAGGGGGSSSSSSELLPRDDNVLLGRLGGASLAEAQTTLDIRQLGGAGPDGQGGDGTVPVYQRTGAEFDGRVRAHTSWLGALAAASAVLMVVILQQPWTGEEYAPDGTTEVLKAVLSGVTAALCWRLYQYYALLVFVGRVRLGILGRVPLRHSSLFPWFLLELAVCGVHPLPYVARGYERLGIIVLARLYLFVRVWRDHSPVYRLRREILASGRLRRGMPLFNSSLTVREAFYRRPFAFAFACVLLSMLALAYMLHVSERQAQPSVFGSLDNALYFAAVTMTTVGYGDLKVVTGWGRSVAMVAALAGILLAALLVAALIRSLELNLNERAAAEYVVWRAQHTREQRVAVRMIEAAYLRHRYLRDRARGTPEALAARDKARRGRKVFGCPPCARREEEGDGLTYEWLEHRRQFRECVHQRLLRDVEEGDLVTATLAQVDTRTRRLEEMLERALLQQKV